MTELIENRQEDEMTTTTASDVVRLYVWIGSTRYFMGTAPRFLVTQQLRDHLPNLDIEDRTR